MTTDIMAMLEDENKEKVTDEMLSVAWKLANEEGQVKLDEFIEACLSKDEFSNILSTRIHTLFKGE